MAIPSNRNMDFSFLERVKGFSEWADANAVRSIRLQLRNEIRNWNTFESVTSSPYEIVHKNSTLVERPILVINAVSRARRILPIVG